MKSTAIILGSLIFLVHPWAVGGFPYGAGACPAGIAAVDGNHLRFDPTTGTLADGSLKMFLDGTPLVAGTPMDFEVGINHTLTVLRTSGTFRGLLFRLETSDMSALIPRGNLQVSSECENVPGITHTGPSDKRNASAILFMNSASSGMALDVTIVVRIRSSQFYYSGYVLNAVNGSPSASKSPAPTPLATVDIPSSSPSAPSSLVTSTPSVTPYPPSYAPLPSMNTTTPAISMASKSPTPTPMATVATPSSSSFTPSSLPTSATPTVPPYSPSYAPLPSMNTTTPAISMVPEAAMPSSPVAAPVPVALPASTTSSASVSRLDFSMVALLWMLIGAVPFFMC